MSRSITSLEQEQDGIMRQEDDDDDEDDDAIPSHLQDKTTSLQSFLHLLKGYVGPGCLSLPWAFSQLGLFSGTVACFGLAYWSSYNCWRVVRLKRTMSSTHHHHHHHVTYPDVARWLYGNKMHHFTTASICVQQLAICTVFLSFVGVNLQAVLESVWNVPIGHVGVISLALPAVMALSFLPNLKALAPVTAAGTVLLLIGLSLLTVVLVKEWPNRPDAPLPLDWKQVPLALCAILYSYEGICLILPIESAMQRPHKFFGVFTTAMITSASIYAIVAVSSVATFGAVTDGSITAFLLEKYAHNNDVKGWLLAANAAVSLSVLVTYPLQLFPAIELLGPLLSSRPSENDFHSLDQSDEEGQQHAESSSSPTAVVTTSDQAVVVSSQPTSNNHNSSSNRSVASSVSSIDDNVDSPKTRVALVLLTYVVAAAVPNVQALISLAGALAGSSTALLIPPLLDLAYLRQVGIRDWQVTKCYVLLGGGFVFLCIGTFASIADIVRVYRGG